MVHEEARRQPGPGHPREVLGVPDRHVLDAVPLVVRTHAGQRAFVQRDSGDHSDVRRLDGREELVLWALVEDVVDDLDGVDDA